MNATNNPTVDAVAAMAQHAGYNFSGTEVAAACALAGGAVHYLHIIVSAYGRAGGLTGIKQFIKTGKTT